MSGLAYAACSEQTTVSEIAERPVMTQRVPGARRKNDAQLMLAGDLRWTPNNKTIKDWDASGNRLKDL
jgi:hypothetical protein